MTCDMSLLTRHQKGVPSDGCNGSRLEMRSQDLIKFTALGFLQFQEFGNGRKSKEKADGEVQEHY